METADAGLLPEAMRREALAAARTLPPPLPQPLTYLYLYPYPDP